VKADLSDLLDVIRWCKKNDDKCQEIARNGMEFARSILSKKYIQSYLQNMMWSLSEKRKIAIVDEKVTDKPRKTQKQSPNKNNKTVKIKQAAEKGAKAAEKEAKAAEKEAIKAAAKADKEAIKAAANAAKEAAKAQEYEYTEMKPDQKKCPKGSTAAVVNGIKMCKKKKE
jgi:hypothetical protein